MMKRILYQPFFIKLFNWEYWPFHIVYGPIYFYWFWLCLRARSFFFFNTANPTIKNGGFLMESKWEIYKLIPTKYYPDTLFFKAGVNVEKIIVAVRNSQIQYPLIVKPDIGMKGLAVKKIYAESELSEYISTSRVDLLIQDYVSFQNEAGIFYYRFPGEQQGHISGIVGKEFLAVTGDRTSTIMELLMKNKRYVLQIDILRITYGDELNKILKKGEELILVPYGNHVRGAKFIDCSDLVDEQLTLTIDRICKQVDGFYFGRLDIRYNTWEELKEGKNFSIIELNGAGSEPTHMYDPKHSIFFAWKEIIRHWKILWKISRLNHEILKEPYMSIKNGLTMFKENSKYLRLVEESSK